MQTPATPNGKGRPTPKRSDAERGRRKPVAAPTTGKEANKLRRQEAAENRLKMRHALATGDENNLPLRDRGPVRRYVRDFVDVRLSLSEWFVPAAVPLYLVMLLGNHTVAGNIATLAILLFTMLVLLELLVMSLQLGRHLKRKFPDKSRKGARLYAVMRSAQMRRLRAPKPQIKRFATID
ncbi:MAG: hypothetical protein QOF57_2240 [Frankiaceae bacterium]|nr:hypothetical protein [Frankiaceae bacterium]